MRLTEWRRRSMAAVMSLAMLAGSVAGGLAVAAEEPEFSEIQVEEVLDPVQEAGAEDTFKEPEMAEDVFLEEAPLAAEIGEGMEEEELLLDMEILEEVPVETEMAAEPAEAGEVAESAAEEAETPEETEAEAAELLAPDGLLIEAIEETQTNEELETQIKEELKIEARELASPNFESAGMIELGVETTAEISQAGGMATFRFVPAQSGHYRFYSSKQIEGQDPYGYLYDADGNKLASDDDDGGSLNFSMTPYMIGGETYYLGAAFYDDTATGSYPVKIESVFAVSSEQTEYIINRGGTATLSVRTEDGVNRQWYRLSEGVWEEIPNETAGTYTTPSLSESAEYLCRVWRGDESAECSFQVGILKGDSSTSSFDNPIPIAFQESCPVAITEQGGTVCLKFTPVLTRYYTINRTPRDKTVTTVYDSERKPLGYGYTYYECFLEAGKDYYIVVGFEEEDSGNTGYITVSIPYYSIPLESSERYPFVKAGDPATLQAYVEGCDPNEFTWKWEVYNEAEDTYQEIDGATGATYTIPSVTEDSKYLCTVTDGNGYSRSLDFRVTVPKVDPALSFETAAPLAPGTSWATISNGGDSMYFMFAPERTRFYRFSANDQYNNDNVRMYLLDARGEILTDSEDSSLSSELESGQTYYLKVEYENSARTGNIEVHLNYELGLRAEKTEYVVGAGERVTLQVQVPGYEQGGLTLQWYAVTEGETAIPYETSAVFVTPPAEHDEMTYRCKATDENGISESVSFLVYIKKGEPAASFEEAAVLLAGQDTWATIVQCDNSMYFRFVPEKSGHYRFYSNTTKDTVGTLYTGNQEELSSDDDGGVDSNFLIVCSLEAGQTYYLKVKFYSSSRVGCFLVRAESEEALSCQHQEDAGTVTRVPTCAQEGEKVYRCTICGTTIRTEMLPKTAHQSDAGTVTKVPTCAQEGEKVYKCAICGLALRTEVLPKTEHQMGEWKTKTAATVFEPETQERSCAVCGVQELQTVGTKLKPSIKLNASKLVLKTKQTTSALKVTGLAEGDSVASYSSGNKKLVTVSKKGKITAKSKTGTTTITIKLKSGLKKTIKVVVQKKKVTTKKISGISKKLTMKKGSSFTLRPVLDPITSSDKITYKSSKASVVSASSKGVLKAKKAGKAVITVKSGKKSVKCTVTVKK